MKPAPDRIIEAAVPTVVAEEVMEEAAGVEAMAVVEAVDQVEEEEDSGDIKIKQ